MGIRIRTVGVNDRDRVARFLKATAGSPRQARRGGLFDATDQPGYLAIDERSEAIVGVTTYAPGGGSWELCTLFAEPRHAGIGTSLLDTVVARARGAGAIRLWLITTNDNLEALRFYQRRGFSLVAIHTEAVMRARRDLKPSIPETGNFGIPIRDEIELALEL